MFSQEIGNLRALTLVGIAYKLQNLLKSRVNSIRKAIEIKVKWVACNKSCKQYQKKKMKKHLLIHQRNNLNWLKVSWVLMPAQLMQMKFQQLLLDNLMMLRKPKLVKLRVLKKPKPSAKTQSYKNSRSSQDFQQTKESKKKMLEIKNFVTIFAVL